MNLITAGYCHTILLQAAIMGGIIMFFGYVASLLIGMPVWLTITRTRLRNEMPERSFTFFGILLNLLASFVVITVVYLILISLFFAFSDYSSST